MVICKEREITHEEKLHGPILKFKDDKEVLGIPN